MAKYVHLEFIDDAESGWVAAYFSENKLIAIKIPAGQLDDENKDEDSEALGNAGIYIMLGLDENNNDIAYIGQVSRRENGESFKERFKEHEKNDKDSHKWKERIIISKHEISSINENFNPTQLNYLEDMLIKQADNMKRYRLTNKKKPNPSNVPMDKEARDNCNKNYNDIMRLVYSLGCEIFTQDVVPEENESLINSVQGISPVPITKTKKKRKEKGPVIKPTGFILWNKEYTDVLNWVDIIDKTMQILVEKDPDKLYKLAESNFTIAEKEKKNPKVFVTLQIDQSIKERYHSITVNNQLIYYNININRETEKKFLTKLIKEFDPNSLIEIKETTID